MVAMTYFTLSCFENISTTSFDTDAEQTCEEKLALQSQHLRLTVIAAPRLVDMLDSNNWSTTCELDQKKQTLLDMSLHGF
jgi:hypothetical protein